MTDHSHQRHSLETNIKDNSVKRWWFLIHAMHHKTMLLSNAFHGLNLSKSLVLVAMRLQGVYSHNALFENKYWVCYPWQNRLLYCSRSDGRISEFGYSTAMITRTVPCLQIIYEDSKGICLSHLPITPLQSFQ